MFERFLKNLELVEKIWMSL